MAINVWDIGLVFESIILVLSLAMLYTFATRWESIKSRFTLGLIATSCVFSIQAALTLYVYTVFSKHYGATLSVPLATLSILEFIGVATLYYLSQQ
ncbi:MAG: hypothetical protein QW514_02830 [Thermoprotei archaeon]